MAKRPIFIPQYSGNLLVRTEYIDFKWFAGMTTSQKQKSVHSFHSAAMSIGACQSPLEISTKSLVDLGVGLSAFNLKITTQKLAKTFTVESAYQSSKVFENGGPYKDLLEAPSLAAKRDPRLKESGNLIHFDFFGDRWDLEPKTAFYDWVYINALHKNELAVVELNGYDSFTDIEFNPIKSLNCQAYSVALYKSLAERKLITKATTSKSDYFEIIKSVSVNNSQENTAIQPLLL